MTVYTEPTNLVLGVEADAAQVNDEVIANIRNLHERNHTRGVVGSCGVLTVNGTGLTSSGVISDMELVANVRMDRAYRITIQLPWTMNAAGSWTIDVRVNGGVTIGRLGWLAAGAAGNDCLWGSCLWFPDIEGAVGLVPLATEQSGASTFAPVGDATAPRVFYVEDIGARP